MFLHWQVDAARIAETLPAGLEVDTFDDKTYLGLVPFTMRDVSPWWSPSVPGISNFHELNMRCYVLHEGVPGVWFYSLEAANALAVVVARAGWKLPYHKASMELDIDGDDYRYTSRRRWPKPKPADFEARYSVGAQRGTAEHGTLDHWLVERYMLFTHDGNTLLSGHVHHEPYPLRGVTLHEVQQTIIDAAGLGPVAGKPLAHFSDGVDVDVYELSAARPS